MFLNVCLLLSIKNLKKRKEKKEVVFELFLILFFIGFFVCPPCESVCFFNGFCYQHYLAGTGLLGQFSLHKKTLFVGCLFLGLLTQNLGI